MKRILIILLLALPAVSRAQHGKYIITGQLQSNDMQKWAYLWLYEDGAERGTMDSSRIIKGKFSFRGYVPYVRYATLTIKPVRKSEIKNDIKDEINFFVEPGHTIVSTRKRLGSAVIKGSVINQQYTEFQKLISEPETDMSESLKHKGDTVANRRYLIAEARRLAILEDYALKNPASYPALTAIGQLMEDPGTDIRQIKQVYAALSPDLQNSHAGSTLRLKIENRLRTMIGAQAPDFTQQDTAGKPVSLSTFRGKYVLVDFWASWCVPCRAENPNLVKAYNKYRTKNFDIISVALEFSKSPDPWKSAIAQDKMTWTNVWQDKFFKNEAALIYDVTSVPQNVLIDPSGVIIARNLRGEALERKLAELLKD